MRSKRQYSHIGIGLRVLVFLILLSALVWGPRPAIRVQAAEISVPCDVAQLIAAINSANANGQADTIDLAAGCTYSLTAEDHDTDGPNGLPSFTSQITVNGNGALIDGNESYRILHVAQSGDLVLNNLTLSNGAVSGDYFCPDDWPFPVCTAEGLGGGILNRGTLELVHSAVTGNGAWECETAAGMYNAASGTVTLDHTTVGGNVAYRFGGTAGIVNDGTMNLIDSTVSGNHPEDDPAGRGGIVNNGDMILTNSTVSHNFGSGIGNSGDLTLIHSTVSNNDAVSGPGIDNKGTAALINSSVADNESWDEACNGLCNNGTLTLRNTLVANPATGPDCGGGNPITSQGHNLDSDGTCGLTHPTDQPHTAPRLGPLQDNGGPTQTHALLAGSPAIDQGSCPEATADQRGLPRPVDLPGVDNAADGCDIGAFELQHTPGGYLVGINVLHKNRKVLPGWKVTVYAGPDGTGGVWTRSTTDANGRVVLRLPNGSYSYVVAHDCYQSGFTNFTVDGARVRMSHQAVVPLKIRVVDSAGQGQPGHLVRLYDADMQPIWWRTTPDSGLVTFYLDADQGHYFVVERDGILEYPSWHLACELTETEYVLD